MKRKTLVTIAGFTLTAVIPFILFIFRPPVLIVTDMAFIPLYGESRIQKETFHSSLALFRPVKIVPIADDVGADIIRYAIVETSDKPFCVIFSLRFAEAARHYREHHPETPVIILEGRYGETANPAAFAINNRDDYYIYKTDITTDFYIAGLAAAILDRDKNGRIAVFFEPHIQAQAREAFSSALNDAEKPLQTSYFTTFSQYSENPNLSSVVLAGTGIDYLERNSGVPVIFFSWIDPELMPADVVMVLNDSPFIQAAEAARMAGAGNKRGHIRSKKLVLPGKDMDKDTKKKLRNL